MKNIPSYYQTYEAVLGIEIHIQLKTEQKIFCNCMANTSNSQPNTHICPICCGYPGILPLLNKEVVKCAIMAGLATNCTVNTRSSFARKHYFYADLPKGYQITQDRFPVCEYGYIPIKTESDSIKKIRIRRIHIEEDAGKNIHTESQGSLVDLNRAGMPLLEIVTYPDLSSAYEAVEYLKAVHSIMTSLGITTGNMEEGAFRADTNISVRKKGETEIGTKCELKNINSFKFIKDATSYEIIRQIDLLEEGETIIQQTRLWDTKLKQTYAMRNKETSQDYRYLEDPDLTPLIITEEEIELVRRELPELPEQKKMRFVTHYSLSPADATILTQNTLLSRYFEEAYEKQPSKLLTHWIIRDILGALKEKSLSFEENQFSTDYLCELISLLESQKIPTQIAKEIFEATFYPAHSPLMYAQKNKLLSGLLDEQSVKLIIEKVTTQFSDAFAEFQAGKAKARGFLMGKIMELTKGRADPKLITVLLDQKVRS